MPVDPKMFVQDVVQLVHNRSNEIEKKIDESIRDEKNFLHFMCQGH